MRTERERGDEALIPRLLIRLADGVCRAPWAVLALAALLCAASAYLACTRLEFRTQRSDLISPKKDFQQRWLKYLDEFGADEDMVVVVEGRDRARMQEALEALARQVEKQPAHFDRLFYKVDLRGLHDRALLFLPADEIRRIQDNLQSMRLLLEPPLLGGIDPLVGWRNLTLLQLLAEAQRRAELLGQGQAPTDADRQFLGQLASIARAAARALEDPARYRNPWQSIVQRPPEQKDLVAEPQYFFSGDGSLAFLLVRPANKDSGSFTSAQASVEALRAVVEQTRPRFPDLAFGLTGLPVLEHDEMLASQNDTTLASWLALAGLAVLYLVVFRGPRYPLLTVSTLLVGTAWALGWLTLTVGHLNILSATFAVMLIGMGDYGVLWVTRYDQERAAGADVMTAMRATAGGVGPGILTSAVTAALAFFAALLVDFQAIAELGWIAGSGVLLCAVSCFTVMPALLKVTDRRRAVAPRAVVGGLIVRQDAAHAPRPAWLPGLAGRPRWVIGASVALTAVLAAFACRITYDHNLLHLQARGLDSVAWELKLIDRTAGASWHAVSYTATAQEALALKARFERLPGVSKVVEVASLVPPGQEVKLEQLRDIQHRLRRLPPRGREIPHDCPCAGLVGEKLAALLGALDGLPAGTACPTLADLRGGLRGLHERLATMDPATAGSALQRFEQWLARDLADDLHRLRDVATPAPITVADLPASLRERHVGQSGKWLLRVFGRDCLWEYGPLREFVEQVRTVDPEATGQPFGTLEGLRAMKHGFLWAGLYALIAIVLVLLLDLRTLKHTLIALAPLAMGLAATLGLLALFGVPLNPANMIAFPLILGVGADNGVHVLHDYLSRRRGQRYTLNAATGRGIMVAALTTVLGFGTLMISHHRGLAGLGLILTLGVSCCMLAALVFLPALLRLLSTRKEPAASCALPVQRLAA